MKKLLFAILFGIGLCILPGCGGSSTNKDRADSKNVIDVAEVPAATQQAFAAKYPTATQVIWEKAHEGDMDTYKVKFKKRNEYMKAEYQADGTLIKVEIDD